MTVRITMTWPQHQRLECCRDGVVVKLQPRQRDILSLLLMRHPHPLSVTELVEIMWPNPDDEPEWSENVIAVHMTALRHRLGMKLPYRRDGYTID